LGGGVEYQEDIKRCPSVASLIVDTVDEMVAANQLHGILDAHTEIDVFLSGAYGK